MWLKIGYILNFLKMFCPRAKQESASENMCKTFTI